MKVKVIKMGKFDMRSYRLNLSNVGVMNEERLKEELNGYYETFRTMYKEHKMCSKEQLSDLVQEVLKRHHNKIVDVRQIVYEYGSDKIIGFEVLTNQWNKDKYKEPYRFDMLKVFIDLTNNRLVYNTEDYDFEELRY